jgi:hypothetical protein
MKPSSQHATLALAFATAVACSDMTPPKPELESDGPEKALAGAKSSYGGSKAKSTASGGVGTTSGGTRSSTASGGKATSGTSSSSGASGGVPEGAGSGGDPVGEGGGAGAASGAAGTSSEPSQITPPLFSEYVEGTGSNKALELASVEPRRLDGCVIRMYANGAVNASRSIPLTGIVMPEAPIVICSPQLSALLGVVCDFSETLPFNGNDAIVLSCDGDVVDSIGQLGSDPGEAGWGSGALWTQDRTLRRRCAISAGDREPSDAFEPSADGWTSTDTDTFDGLGVRCEPPLDNGAGGDSGAGGAGGSAGAGMSGAAGETAASGELNRATGSLG